MKSNRLIVSVILILIASFAFGQQTWVPFTSETPESPEITIIEQNSSGLIVEIEIPGMYVTPVEVNGTTYQRLELYSWQTTKDIGKPELPMINEIIGIPSGKKIKATILSSSTTILEDYLVFPFQTPSKDVSGGQSDEFIIDQDFYRQAGAYPLSNVNIDKPGIWRDVKISGLHIVPFTYNPAQKALEVVKRIRIAVEFYGIDTETTVTRSKNISSPIYKMYASRILNFESLGYAGNHRDADDIKYLIITNDNPLSTIQPFVDWKNRQGFRVEVRTMETGFNTSQNFKDYITQLYNSDNLEYVLMVGDAYPNGGNNPGDPDDVPMFWWQPSGEDGSYSDTWYVCLDGPDDHFADLAIGRFVYDDLTELELQINKTLDFYMEPDAETNWAENSILVAHQEQYPQKYTQCKNEIESYNYALQIPVFEECYGGAGATNQDIVDYINANSCGIFNYRGHGSATAFTGWGPSGNFTSANIAQFTNNDRLFVVFDVCCDNMDIVAFAGNCLCESFMKSPVAAVAINGAIIPSYTIPNHDYDKEMYKAVFNEGIYNIGYVTNYANVTVVNNHGTIGRSNVRTYLWLGDASIEPWTLQPDDLIVDHLPTLLLGMDEFTITVNGSAGPIEGARVCLTNDDLSLYALGFTDASGEVVLDLGGPVTDPGTATITVTYHNYLPYQEDIPIIPADGPYIIFLDYDIDDATGNNNGFADFGEHIKLDVTLENIGLDSAVQVTTTISTNDEMVTLIDSIHEWGVIPGSSQALADSAFSLDVALDAPDQHVVYFDMIIEDESDQIWLESFELLLNAPVLDILEMVIDDSQNGNNNGRLDPGENAIIKIKNKNTGHCPAENTMAYLETTSQYIEMLNTEDSLETLGLLGFKYAEFEVNVDPDAPNGVVFAEFDYELESGIFIEEKTFIRKIGLLVEDWETGDFSKFDWQHSGTYPWEITMLYPFEGNYHARSGQIGNSELCALSLSMEVMTADTIYFWQKVSSENGDKLKFYMNNNLMDEWSGTGVGYTPEKYRVEVGNHTFKWVYQKNSANSSGSDAAWIDFIIMPPRLTLTCYAGVDANICAGDDYPCLGEATDWVSILWTSSGTGTFDDPTILEPIYTPSADDILNGFAKLTITAENQAGLTADDEMGLIIEDIPIIPSIPDGPDYVDLLVTISSDYTTNTVQYADEYAWQIDPLEAGTISGNSTSGNVQWNQSFLGTASISVKAINQCGESDYSENYEVTVDNTVGIHETLDGVIVHIYPNPSKGDFVVDLNSSSGQSVDIRIFNALGNLVYSMPNIQFNGKFTKNLDLNNLPEGLYFLQLNTNKGLLTKKLIINR